MVLIPLAEGRGLEPSTGFPAPDFESGKRVKTLSKHGPNTAGRGHHQGGFRSAFSEVFRDWVPLQVPRTARRSIKGAGVGPGTILGTARFSTPLLGPPADLRIEPAPPARWRDTSYVPRLCLRGDFKRPPGAPPTVQILNQTPGVPETNGYHLPSLLTHIEIRVSLGNLAGKPLANVTDEMITNGSRRHGHTLEDEARPIWRREFWA
jgi:hypothetical protein